MRPGSTRVSRGLGVVDLLVEAGLVKSKGEARRTISEGGAYLNNERITDVEQVPGEDDLLAGELAGPAAGQEEPRRCGGALSR